MKRKPVTGWARQRERGLRVWEDLTRGGPAPGARHSGWRTLFQFVYQVARGFVDNRCAVRAAALAYTTLLALVPLLAVAFSVSQNFLHDSSAKVVPKLLDRAVTLIAPQLQDLPAGDAARASGDVVISSRARQEAVEKIQTFIGNIDAGALGLVGSILLVVVAIRLLMTIEATFNDIWGLSQGRSIWRKVVYYWATITLGPLLIVGTLTLTSTVEFSRLYGQIRLAPWINTFLLELAPFALLWLGFTLLYALMPNTTVRPRAALFGGVVGGTLWQLNSLLSTMYLSHVVAYSKIYGALGIIPVFLAGLYLSWFIVLLGAQVSFVAQHFESSRWSRPREELDSAESDRVACRLVRLVCQHFLRGTELPALEELSAQLGTPLPLLQQLVDRLMQGGVLTKTGDDDPRLLPARPPDSITVADVLQVVRHRAGVGAAPPPARPPDFMENVLDDLRAAERTLPANLTFQELADRPDPTTS